MQVHNRCHCTAVSCLMQHMYDSQTHEMFCFVNNLCQCSYKASQALQKCTVSTMYCQTQLQFLRAMTAMTATCPRSVISLPAPTFADIGRSPRSPPGANDTESGTRERHALYTSCAFRALHTALARHVLSHTEQLPGDDNSHDKRNSDCGFLLA